MKKLALIGLLSVVSFADLGNWLDDMKKKAEETKNQTAQFYDEAKKKAVETKNKTVQMYNDYNKEKEQEHKQKIDACVNSLKVSLPIYRTLIEEYYLDANKRNEERILHTYKKLREKGISPELKSSLDSAMLDKLKHSRTTLEFTNIVLRALKNIESELKNGDPKQLDRLVKATRFLLFSWTAPYEVFGTRKIYDHSLLELNPLLYDSLDKETYANYSHFIYSLLYVNMLNNNIFIKKNNAFIGVARVAHTSGATLQNKDTAGLQKVCEEISDSYFRKDVDEYLKENLSENLGIDKNRIESGAREISKKNNLYMAPMLFNDRGVTNAKVVSIVDNPLNDNWYMMLREYMKLQNSFYSVKKRVESISKIVNAYKNSESSVAMLEQDLIRVDALYRKMDETARYNIIDLPVAIYADLYVIDFKRAKSWYDDNEDKMADVAVAYNKACANMQKYMVSEFAIKKVIRAHSVMKSEFEDVEWKQIITRAKLTQDWFNMLNKITIKNK